MPLKFSCSSRCPRQPFKSCPFSPSVDGCSLDFLPLSPVPVQVTSSHRGEASWDRLLFCIFAGGGAQHPPDVQVISEDPRDSWIFPALASLFNWSGSSCLAWASTKINSFPFYLNIKRKVGNLCHCSVTSQLLFFCFGLWIACLSLMVFQRFIEMQLP